MDSACNFQSLGSCFGQLQYGETGIEPAGLCREIDHAVLRVGGCYRNIICLSAFIESRRKSKTFFDLSCKQKNRKP